jgi:hypothetical protein
MAKYFVTWEIDVEDTDAANPREAAEFALKIMGEAAKDSDSLARCFTVDDRETSETHHIDLFRSGE